MSEDKKTNVKNSSSTRKTSTTRNKNTTPKNTSTRKKKLTLNERLNNVIENINQDKYKITIVDEDTEKETTYVPVRFRVLEMRKEFGFDLKIITELLSGDDLGQHALFSTTIFIKDDQGEWQEVSTGHSFENKAASASNQINFLENAETSSVGRALANLGVDGGHVSDLELLKQKTNDGLKDQRGKPIEKKTTNSGKEKASKEQIERIKKLLKSTQTPLNQILKSSRAKKIEDITGARADEIISLLDDEDSIL